MPDSLTFWIVPALSSMCVIGVSYIILQSLLAGAEDYTRQYTETAARHLEDIYLFIPPKRIFDLALALAASFFILVFIVTGSFSSLKSILGGLILGALAGFCGWRLPHQILIYLKVRRLRRFNSQMSDSLLTMSNALKAGFSILQAFETVARSGQDPIAQEFSVFLHEMRVGVKFEDGLYNLKARVGSEDLTLMIVAIETARLTGGNLTEVLENIAHTIRERARIERRIRTLTAMGRLQGAIVAAMPFLLAAAMTALDPALMVGFFHSSTGMATVVAVIGLEIIGILLIRKIVRIDI